MFTSYFTKYTKINSNGIECLNVKIKTKKFIEKNTWKCLQGLGLSEVILKRKKALIVNPTNLAVLN